MLNYIDRREVQNRPSFLNYDFETLRGDANSIPQYQVRTSPISTRCDFGYDPFVEGENRLTRGIHSHGCGYIPIAKQNSSQYQYVTQVIKKAKENYGVTLTKESIYDGTQDDVVQKCVEDLIVDEEAMELAFEGTRFFDLMRVAHRRSDPDYLASRVSRRDPSLRGKLQNPKNWYFPLPSK